MTLDISKNQKLIMFIGKTHSGKTTLAKELKRELKERVLILEADPIVLFINEEFPELKESADKEHTGAFENINLKYRTFLLFLEEGLSLGQSIILSNSNMWEKGRSLVFKLCKKYNYEVIGVYFDLPDDVLLKRVQEGGRPTNVLRTSNNFEELVAKQEKRMQVPNPSDFDEFIRIDKDSNIENIKNELVEIFS